MTLGVTLAACGGSDDDGAPPPLSSRGGDGAPAPAPEAGAPSAPTDGGRADGGRPAPLPDQTFAGTLAKSKTVVFGGSPYCTYSMTLENIAIEVTFDGSGDVKAATVTNRAVERALFDCPNPAQPPSDHSYTLTSAYTTVTGTRLELAGAGTNSPRTSLVVNLETPNGAYEANMTWKRTDQAPSLNWTVAEKLLLAPKP